MTSLWPTGRFPGHQPACFPPLQAGLEAPTDLEGETGLPPLGLGAGSLAAEREALGLWDRRAPFPPAWGWAISRQGLSLELPLGWAGVVLNAGLPPPTPRLRPQNVWGLKWDFG